MQNNIDLDIIPPSPKTLRGYLSSIDVNDNYLLYFNGNTVILKPQSNKNKLLYVNHISQVSACKFSPNNQFVASIDSKGCLLIHQICPQKLIQTHKIQGFFPNAKCIDWTSDCKRICVVGDGKKQFGRVIMIDTNTNAGQISCVTAPLNSCSFRSQRPFKLAVGGDENSIKFYDGPPFAFKKSQKHHSGFINQIKYSPKGKYIASVGADKKIVIYDGVTFQKLIQKQKSHEGGIFGIDWISEEILVTVSSDKYIKIWDINLTERYILPSTSPQNMKNQKKIQYFLVAVKVWKDRIYTINLSGDILVFENPLLQKNPNPICTIQHNRSKLVSIFNYENNVFLLDNSGRIIKYCLKNNTTQTIWNQLQIKNILQASHQQQIIYILREDGCVLTVNIKNQQKYSSTYKFTNITSGTTLQNIITTYQNKLTIYSPKDNKIIKEIIINQQVTCLKANNQFITAGTNKGNVYIYKNDLKLIHKIEMKTFKITAINLIHIQNSQKTLIFIGDSYGTLKLLQFTNQSIQIVRDPMGGHNTVITTILFDKQYLYTLSMDGNIIIWNRQDYMKKKTITNVSNLGIVTGVLSSKSIVISGGDLLTKFIPNN